MSFMVDNPDVAYVLFSREEIEQRVAELGRQIAADYAGKRPLLVGILRGAVVFLADLIRAIDLPVEMDFMVASSYGNAASSSGTVRITKDLETDISGRDVLIVEDVVDSGLTQKFLIEELSSRSAASVEMVVLMHKGRPGAYRGRYVGFDCPDDFIVGYGLDYAQAYRNLPYAGVLAPGVYQ